MARIASEAANEVEHTAGRRERLLARGSGEHRPEATVTLDGGWARIGIAVAVDYPVSLPAVTRAVRARVAERLRDLADVEARQVDVTITALRVPAVERERVQ